MINDKAELVLAIEAAIGQGSLALFSDGELIAEVAGDPGVARANELLPAIDLILRSHKIKATMLSRIVVGAGPGSFTGIRVAVSTALGLAAPLSLPVSLISSLEAIAASSPDDRLFAAIPLGRERICVQNFIRDSAGLRAASVPEVWAESDLVDKVRRSSDDRWIVHHSIFSTIAEADRESITDCGEGIAKHIGYASIRRSVSNLETPLFVGRQR